MNDIFRPLIALAMLVGSFGVSGAQGVGTTDIDDLALIYVGNRDRTEWTRDKLQPYVMHTYDDGSQTWMFDEIGRASCRERV